MFVKLGLSQWGGTWSGVSKEGQDNQGVEETEEHFFLNLYLIFQVMKERMVRWVHLVALYTHCNVWQAVSANFFLIGKKVGI